MDILGNIIGWLFTALLLAVIFPIAAVGFCSAVNLCTAGVVVVIRRHWPSWAVGMVCGGAVQLAFLIATVVPVLSDWSDWGDFQVFAILAINMYGAYSFGAGLAAFAAATLFTFVIMKIYRTIFYKTLRFEEQEPVRE